MINTKIVGKTQIFVFVAWFSMLIFLILTFYPGAMTWDSIDQLRQASSGQYRDWQPPFMSLIWSLLLFFTNKVGSIFILQFAILCVSCALYFIKYRNNAASYGFLLVPFLPWVMNFEFVVWKDVLMANVFIFVICYTSLQKNSEKKIFNFVISTALLLCGSLFRHNSLPAAIPLLAFIYVCYYKINYLKLLGYIVLFFCLNKLAIALIFLAFDVEKNFPFVYVMFDDFVGVYRMGVGSYIPLIANDMDLHKLMNCNTDIGFAFCIDPHLFDNLEVQEYKKIFNEWTLLLLRSPIEYFKYRFNAFIGFIGLPSLSPSMFYYFDIPNTAASYQLYPALYVSIRDFLINLYGTIYKPIFFTFTPFFWMVLAVFCLFASRCLNLKYNSYIIISALVYQLSFFVSAPTYDFRFSYWLVLVVVFEVIKYIMIFRKASYFSDGKHVL